MLLFTYRDSKGVLSRRKLTSYNDDGTYIRGFCSYSNGLRTFRKDRVEKEYLTEDNEEFLAVPVQDDSKRPKRPSPVYSFEICFTGFDKLTRAGLEESASTNNILVRKSVTRALDFLCIGENAGAKKMLKAEKQGVVLMTEDEFNDLVNLGLMPEGWANERH